MTSSMEIWNNWFLWATLKENNLLDVSLKSEEIPHDLFKTKKKDWNLHIVKNIKGKPFMSSSIQVFDLKTMKVKTNNGSIYQLGNPENMNQLKKIMNHFNWV